MDNNDWFKGAKFIVETLDQPIFPILSFMVGKEAVTTPTKGGYKEGANAEEWIKRNGSDAGPVPPFPTKNLEIIRDWADDPRYPAYGVLAYRNYVFIDVDIKNGGRGAEAIAWLHENGLPENVLRVNTPTGGWHLYFRAPETYKIKQAVNAEVSDDEFMTLFAPDTNIDIRYGNGYVLGPGSMKRKADGTWSDAYTVVDREALPGILPDSPRISEVEAVIADKPFTIATSGIEDWFYSTELVPEGGRDDFATKFTYLLASKDLSQKEIALHLANLTTRVHGGVTAEKIEQLYTTALDKVGKDPSDPVKEMVSRYYKAFLGKELLFFDTKYRRVLSPAALLLTSKTKSFKIETDKGPKRVNPYDEFVYRKDMKKIGSVQYIPSKEAIHTDKNGNVSGNLCHLWDQDLVINPDVHVTVSVQAFLDVFKHVLGGDAVPIMRWVVAAYFHPMTRPSWYVYLLSDHKGIGKDIIFGMLRSLFTASNGKKNAAIIKMDDLMDGFNVLMYDNILLTMSDQAKVGSRDKVSKALEEYITAEGGSRQAKGVDKDYVQLYSRLMISNNEADFMEISAGDRRAFVSKCRKEPIESKDTINGIYAKAASCYTVDSDLTSDEQYQCRALILDHFISNMEMNIADTKFYVKGQAPSSDSKAEVQDESSALRFQKVRAAIQEGLDGEFPTFRGASIFHSSVVTDASLKGFLMQELNSNSRGDAVKFAKDLEKEGILSRIRMKARSNGKSDKASIPLFKEEFYVDKDYGTLRCRFISAKKSSVTCYIVNSLWRGSEDPSTTELRNEYMQLFTPHADHEAVIEHDDMELTARLRKQDKTQTTVRAV